MIGPEDVKVANARKCLGQVFDAIPKGKRAAMMREMMVVEATMNDAFRLLELLRGYFLETTGEASPFVKKVDDLMPR